MAKKKRARGRRGTLGHDDLEWTGEVPGDPLLSELNLVEQVLLLASIGHDGLDRWVRTEALAAWGGLTQATQQSSQGVLQLVGLDVPLRHHMKQALPVETTDSRHAEWRATYRQRNREILADALVIWIEDQANSNAVRESALFALIALVSLESAGEADPGLNWIGGQGRTPGKLLPAYTRSAEEMAARDPKQGLPDHLDDRQTTARQALLAISSAPGIGTHLAELGARLANLELRLPRGQAEILKLLREAKGAANQVVRVHGGAVPTWERLSEDSLCLALPQRAHRVVGAHSTEPPPITSPAAGERLVVAFEVFRQAGRKRLLTWEELGQTQACDHPHTAAERALRELRRTTSPSGEDWSDLDKFLNVTKKGIHFRQVWYEVTAKPYPG